jgi:hypothetical protein
MEHTMESLFLKAKGPFFDKQDMLMFDIGNGQFEKGEAICVANPTYDLTFKLLFTPMERNTQFGGLTAKKHSDKRLISLLNSIIYPHFENNPQSEHIISVDLESTEMLAKNDVENEKMEKQLTALRCDIVCKCTILKEQHTQKTSTFVIYFDIEMQRAEVPGRIRAFLRYKDILKEHFPDTGENDIRLIAFLNYETSSAISNAAMAAVGIDPVTNNITLLDADTIEISQLSKMIGLKTVIKKLMDDEEIRITSDIPLKTNGKEWLKLLGLQWWANKTKNDCRYTVPQDVSCAEVKEALQLLNHKGITDEALQNEYQKILGAKTVAQVFEERGEERGEQRGRAEGEIEGKITGKLEILINGFIETQQIFPFMIAGLEQHSLMEDRVRKVWQESNNPKKTEDLLEKFLQTLHEAALLGK